MGKDIGERRQKPAVSVGEVLAEARHRRGFTVAEVSHYTRIREPVIRGIESDDFLLSGGDSHTRGQIQVLATARTGTRAVPARAAAAGADVPPGWPGLVRPEAAAAEEGPRPETTK